MRATKSVLSGPRGTCRRVARLHTSLWTVAGHKGPRSETHKVRDVEKHVDAEGLGEAGAVGPVEAGPVLNEAQLRTGAELSHVSRTLHRTESDTRDAPG